MAMTTESPRDNQSPPPSQPQFIDSISRLRDLSTALSAFQRCYDDLHQHLDYIRAFVDSQLPPNCDNAAAATTTAVSLMATPSTERPLSQITNLVAAVTTSTVPLPGSLTETHSTKIPLPKVIPSTKPTPFEHTEPLSGSSTSTVPLPASSLPIVPETVTTSTKPPLSQPKKPVATTTTSTVLPPSCSSPIVPATRTPSTKSPLLQPVTATTTLTVPFPASSLPTVSVTETPSIQTVNTDTAKPSLSEVEQLCQSMCGRGLRKYMTSHLSEAQKLREEVPLALKHATNAAKIVLECIGKFYLQGSKAYKKNTPMIALREAALLVLECFLLMGTSGVVLEASLEKETDAASTAWRKRLLTEGGLGKASEIDARGLLLFVGCFGVPNVFKDENIKDLIRVGNARAISCALRRSPVLLARIPELLEGMTKNKWELEAVDIAFIFGLQGKFSPQTILMSFVQQSRETWTATKQAIRGSVSALNEANKKHLADLRSVMKCLENNNLDHSEFLPGWHVRENISSLEKDVASFDEKEGKIAAKRKANEVEALKSMKTKEAKRTKIPGHEVSQKVAAQLERGSPYGIMHDGLPSHRSTYSASPVVMHASGGLPGHMNNYLASPSVLHESGGPPIHMSSFPHALPPVGHASFAGSLPDNVPGPTGGSGAGFLAAGIGAGPSAGTGRVPPMSVYPVDTHGYPRRNSGEPYGWRGDPLPPERLGVQSLSGHLSAVGANNSFHGSAQLESFAGLPSYSSLGVSSRRPTSDLYNFVDDIL